MSEPTIGDPHAALHVEIEARDWVDAYLAGRLSDAERDTFEAHYFDCPECLDRLEAAEGFRAGMLDVAAADLGQAAAARTGFGFLAALALLSRRRRLGLGAALLALLGLAVLPTLWLAARYRTLESEMSASKSVGAARVASLEARLAQAERAGAAERERLNGQLATERTASSEAEPPSPRKPQINVPYFVLAAVRGGEGEGEPVNQLRIPTREGSLVLAVELAIVDQSDYRAVLSTSGGRPIWTSAGLHPDGRDTLAILLPARMLDPGLYRLEISGLDRGGRETPLGTYPFRFVR